MSLCQPIRAAGLIVSETPKSSHPCEGSAGAVPGARRSATIKPATRLSFPAKFVLQHIRSTTRQANSLATMSAPGGRSGWQDRRAPGRIIAPAFSALPPSLAVGSATPSLHMDVRFLACPDCHSSHSGRTTKHINTEARIKHAHEYAASACRSQPAPRNRVQSPRS